MASFSVNLLVSIMFPLDTSNDFIVPVSDVVSHCFFKFLWSDSKRAPQCCLLAGVGLLFGRIQTKSSPSTVPGICKFFRLVDTRP